MDLSAETLQIRREWGVNIQYSQRKEFSTQNLISSQTRLHKWRKNENFHEQASIQISSPPGLLYKSFWKKHYTQKGTTSINHPKNLSKGKEYLHNEESISINEQNSQLALNDNIKLTNININPKCKWIKCPNKRNRQANWIKSQNPSVHCIQIHLISKDTQRLKTKGWWKTYQSNGEQKGRQKTKQEL